MTGDTVVTEVPAHRQPSVVVQLEADIEAITASARSRISDETMEKAAREAYGVGKYEWFNAEMSCGCDEDEDCGCGEYDLSLTIRIGGRLCTIPLSDEQANSLKWSIEDVIG